MLQLQSASDPSVLGEDDWHGVTDAKKRKKIQDKLAQRARRKRLREGKQNPKQADETFRPRTSRGGQPCRHCGQTPGLDTPPDSSEGGRPTPSPEKLPEPTDLVSTPRSSTAAPDKQTLDIGYEPYPSLTVIGALYINGNILGMKCCTVVPRKSAPAGPHVPPSLQPTLLQLTTLHQSGIDRFPFPQMRDNLITFDAMIDEEEITRDLCLMPSFTIRNGMAPWDPKAWKVEKYFAEKWSYLFQ